MKYEGVSCPICNGVFDKDADVVVCPECGTPAHRTCYEKNGGCANASKHGDFTWENPNKPEEVETKPVKVAVATSPSAFTKDKMPENGVIGELVTDPSGNTQPLYREIKGNEKLGNYTVDDYAKVVDKNVHKFMPKFLMMDRKKRKVTWNWAAFFFGPFYLAYRKMYIPALVSLLVVFLIPFIFLNEVTDYYSETFTRYGSVMTSEAAKTTEEMEAVFDDLEANLPEQPFAIKAASYVEMLVDIICALYANYLYFEKCTSILDKSKDMEAEQKNKFIKQKGGRGIVGVLILIVMFYAIALLIEFIYTAVGSDLATILRKFIK